MNAAHFPETGMRIKKSTDRLSAALSRRAPASLAVALLFVVGCSSPSDPGPEPPRLVVLVATCSLNKDLLGPYDPEVSFTPNFDRFAREAAVLTSHHTESGLSGTAFASIFSGVQADRHGVFKHPRELDDELYMVFEAFEDAGYETFYWNKQKMAAPELNYSQGVDEKNITRKILRAEGRFTAILERLRAEPDYRALVVAAYTVTHGPYSRDSVHGFMREYPDEAGGLSFVQVSKFHALYVKNCLPLQTQFEATVEKLGLSEDAVSRLAASVDLVYKSRVNHLDSLFGEVIDAIDDRSLADESLIAFTSDHGETLYREDRRFKWTHAPSLAPEVINVALMIRGQHSAVPARRIDHVSRSIDVYPTLAGLAGIEIPASANLHGVDLSRALRGVEEFPELRAYSHGTLRQWSFFDPDVIENIWAQVRSENEIYTWRHPDSDWEFDRLAAPDEPHGATTTLDSTDAESREIAKDLWNYRTHMIDAFRRDNPAEAQSKEDELDQLEDDELEALRSLGYIE